MRRDGYDLIVVGAGVFGLSTAWEAALRGHDVLVVDRSPLPSPAAASTAPSRKIHSTYVDEAYARLVVEAMPAWDRIERDTGETFYLRLGNLVYTATDDQGTLDALQTATERGGASLERLDRWDLRARFPQFRLARHAIFERDGGVLRATIATGAIATLARRAGATVLEGAPVSRLDLEGNEPAVVLEDGRRVTGARLVLAAGVWSPELVPELGAIITLKEEGLAYLPDLPDRFDSPGFSPFTELGAIFYGFPRWGDDPVKIGWHRYGEVTADPNVDRNQVSNRFLEGVREFFREHLGFDASRTAIVGATCVYDLTPTSDFLIDFLPGSSTVLVATGGSGHGFKFGSVIGRVAMDRLDGTAGEWTPTFAWEHVSRGLTSTPDLLRDVIYGGAGEVVEPR